MSTRLIVDSFHTLGRGIDPDSLRSVPGDRIFFVQLADAPAIEMDLLYWSRHFRNMPGEGDLDVAGFMEAVMATGYSGPISLEIFNDLFRGGDTRHLARDGYRSLIHLMDGVRRAEPALPVDLPPLPAPARPEGLAFVEFATRGDEAKALAAQLKTMGFAKTGTHRNKAVSLWQQGEIRLVLNEDTTGHAATSWNARGTNVCDLGLQVPDAHAVVQRAMALGDAPLAVIEGDQQTANDADRIRATGAQAIQVNTGKGCHLDGHMVGHAMEHLELSTGSLLFIENVGNLVCPAAFDLGEDCKVAILSVTEGEDKPLKYPDMFTASRVALLNKVDLAPHCDVDLDLYETNLRRVNPGIEVIRVSARTGEGMDNWLNWLQGSLARKASRVAAE